MTKGASKFPIKFNHNLFIKTGGFKGSDRLVACLNQVLPKSALKSFRWYGTSEFNKAYEVSLNEVVRIYTRKSRIHYHYKVMGSSEEYILRYSEDRDRHGIWITAKAFIELCENKIKEKTKHAATR